MQITAGASSRRGGHRKQNEDAWRIYQDQPNVVRVGRGTVYAVADGVGGTGAGRYASWQVVDGLNLFFGVPAPKPFDPGATLRDVLLRSHETLKRLAGEAREYTMAGSTVSLLYATPARDRGFALGIGDSAVYLLRQGALVRLTEDHRDARGKVTSFIGMASRIQVSSRVLRLDEGDRFLLCTDGVREGLSEDELRELLAADAHPELVAGEITGRAEAAGSLDNATALVVRLGQCPPLHGAVDEADEADDDLDD